MGVQPHFVDRYMHNSVYITEHSKHCPSHIKTNILPYTATQKHVYQQEKLDNEQSVHTPCKSIHYRFLKTNEKQSLFFFSLKTKTNEFTVCTVYTNIYTIF